MGILGLVLIALGIVAIVGGGLPPYGFGRLSEFLTEYQQSKVEKREPSLDAKDAYAVHTVHKIGMYLIVFGGIVWIIGLLI